MSPDKADGLPSASADELQGRLREALKKQRPRRYRFGIALMVFAAGLVGVGVWAFFPKGEAPLVIATAFDDLAVAGKEATLHGWLEAPGEPNLALAGREIVFVDGQAPLVPNQEAREVRKQTGEHGEVSCLWTFPPEATQGDFVLRQHGGKYFPGMEDRGLVFLMPEATPVCLVQIEKTLSSTSDHAWGTENVHDIAAEPAAARVLEEIAKKGYQIVYLTLADEPILYQRVRGWIRLQTAEARPPFPSGPVISRFLLPWADHDKRPWQKIAERLSQRFTLPQGGAVSRHLALAGTIEVAGQFHGADWPTVYVGVGGELPHGVVRANGWENVAAALEK